MALVLTKENEKTIEGDAQCRLHRMLTNEYINTFWKGAKLTSPALTSNCAENFMYLFLQKRLATLFYCIYIVKKDVLIRFSESHGTAGVIYLYLGPLVRLSPPGPVLMAPQDEDDMLAFFL